MKNFSNYYLGISSIKQVQALRIVFILKDVLEIQADAIQKGQKVVVIDDLIATGGELVKKTKQNKTKTKHSELNFFMRRTFLEMVKPGRQATHPHSRTICLVPALNRTSLSYSVPLHFQTLRTN